MSDLSKINFSGTEYNIKDVTARTEAAKKVTASGGDISNTKIVTADSITTEFPVPAANDTAKGFLGKMKKFCTDFNSFKTGIITLGKLVNNGQCTEAGFALDARYGKTLYDLFAQLNRDLITLPVLNYHSGQHIKIGWTGSAAPLMINDVFKGDIALRDDLAKLDHTSNKSTNLGLDLHVYRMGGVVKALYTAGTHTVDWAANTAYGLGTFGGVYAPKISWSKRIIYKYVSGNPHYAVLSMGTDGVVTITPETVSYGGTLRIFETYF